MDQNKEQESLVLDFSGFMPGGMADDLSIGGRCRVCVSEKNTDGVYHYGAERSYLGSYRLQFIPGYHRLFAGTGCCHSHSLSDGLV